MGRYKRIKGAWGGFRGKPKRKIYIKYILLLALVLFFCLLMSRRVREQAIPGEDGDFVRSEELAGYLQVVPLTPAETRALIVEQLENDSTENSYLGAEDIEWLFEYLELGEVPDKVREELDAVGDGFVSREEWSVIYGEMLDILGLKEEVEIIEIQYLGMLTGEGHLMADTGNYECDAGSIDFVYGETYLVYVRGNVLLGRAVREESGNGAGENEEGQEAGADGAAENGSQDATVTELPETVRVLLTRDNGEMIYRENVYLEGEGQLLVSAVSGDGDKAGTSVVGAGAGETVAAGQVLDCAAWMDRNGVDEMLVLPVEGEATGTVGLDGKITQSDEEDTQSDGKTVQSDGENIQTGSRISITDSDGGSVSAAYSGSFHVYRDENGLRVVNEVPLEDYLCGVVPGEMPESFAGEALAAQAVCARTYAVRLVSEKKYEAYGADLNDTTDCQVYLPSAENEKANEAVDATAGQVLAADGALAVIYYFSTSCGLTSGLEVWQTEGYDYLTTVSLLTESSLQKMSSKPAFTLTRTAYAKSVQSEAVLESGGTFDDFLRKTDIAAYDSHSRYFRWTANLDVGSHISELEDALQAEIAKGNGRIGVEDTAGTGISSFENLGGFSGMEVVSRNAAGMVTDLALTFEKGRVHLYHENVIRTVLGTAMTALADKNGESVNTLTILPSAAFSVEAADGAITLYGGGLGHGIGMSQYGADGMAQAGMGYEEILETFFPGTEVQNW